MTDPKQAGHEGLPGEISAEVVRRNIHALARIRAHHRETRDAQSRIADALTAFIGSMRSVYLHLALFGAWFLINTRSVPFLAPFDPYPFVMLAMIASVEAIFLSTFVLISQNRQSELAEKRNDLDLQINLLAEHEITQLITLVDEIAKRLDVPREERETEPLKQDVEPEAVLRDMERAEES